MAIHGFDAFLAAHQAAARDAAHLRQAGPSRPEVGRQAGRRLQRARFDAAMPLADRFGAGEVRRRPCG